MQWVMTGVLSGGSFYLVHPQWFGRVRGKGNLPPSTLTQQPLQQNHVCQPTVHWHHAQKILWSDKKFTSQSLCGKNYILFYTIMTLMPFYKFYQFPSKIKNQMHCRRLEPLIWTPQRQWLCPWSPHCWQQVLWTLKEVFQKHNIDSQRFPLHIHCRNAVEQAIQTRKNHLFSGLATWDPNYTTAE